MFANTRAINAVIAILALFLVVMIFPTIGVDTTVTQAAAVCAFVMLLFIGDCIFRKKEERSDLWFAVAWTLFHSWTTYIGMSRFSALPQELNLFHSMIVATFCGLPLVANLVYLATLREQLKQAS